MIQMLQNFDRDNLETLWKLVKAKHGSTRPYEGYERVLWGDLMTITLSDIAIYAYLYAGREKVSPYTSNNHRHAPNKKLKLKMGMKSVISFLSSSQNSSRILEVFESILLVINEAFNEET
ncbi:hypothetical protein Tco_0611274 [Tanacetum coccineum]